jgi:hypothetical protein
LLVGKPVGDSEGWRLGRKVGLRVGTREGLNVGYREGLSVGFRLGLWVEAEGRRLGDSEGTDVGGEVGETGYIPPPQTQQLSMAVIPKFRNSYPSLTHISYCSYQEQLYRIPPLSYQSGRTS